MINDSPNNTRSGANSKGARIGRAAAWFTAGALGATALTGIAMAATTDADSAETNPGAQMEGRGGPGGKGGPGGHGGPGRHPGGPGGGSMIHSDGVIEDKDGEFQKVTMQQGKVTEVGDDFIAVESEDGYSANYMVNDDTKINKDREEKLIGDIAVGDTVHAMAKKDGDNLAAVRIGAISEEQAAEMEQRREEMRERFEERREQRQKGETTESGFRGGPPAEASSV